MRKSVCYRNSKITRKGEAQETACAERCWKNHARSEISWAKEGFRVGDATTFPISTEQLGKSSGENMSMRCDEERIDAVVAPIDALCSFGNECVGKRRTEYLG